MDSFSPDHGWVAGVDGCRSGWAVCTGVPGEVPTLNVIPSFGDLVCQSTPAVSIIVDIPVGLCDDSVRACDVFLRSLLPWPRSSSVFNAPVRSAVYAQDYPSASRIQQLATGAKLSKQSWNICPKIRDVDEVLRENKAFADCVVESHPEVLYYHLNQKEMFPSKHSEEGRTFRIERLVDAGIDAEAVLKSVDALYRKSEVDSVDWLDAMVLWSAAAGRMDTAVWPEEEVVDSEGVRMKVLVPGKTKR